MNGGSSLLFNLALYLLVMLAVGIYASRLVTVLIAGVALLLAVSNRDFVHDMVSYASAGLGAAFGPPLLLSLRWKRTTRWGMLAGMLAGAVSNIIWKNMPAWNEALDLRIASFAFSLAGTVLVSLATQAGGTRADLARRFPAVDR
jgi:Na+/proline symporter